MSHRRASKLSVKLVPKPCRELNNRKSLGDNPPDKSPKNWLKFVDGIESNRIHKSIETWRHDKARTKAIAQFHFVSENTLIWFQLRWKQQPRQSTITSDNCALCVWVDHSKHLSRGSSPCRCLPCLALTYHALPCPALLLIKCQIASISVGHMWRMPTHSNRNSYSYSSSAELYIWIIEFEFGIEWSLLLLLTSLPTIQFKRLFPTQSLAENVVVNTQRAELSDGRSFISFGWRVRASHAQSAKCCLPASLPVAAAASQTSICTLLHSSIPPHPLLFSCLPACHSVIYFMQLNV